MQLKIEKFKLCMRNLATGVTVITSVDKENAPQGITINSFNSLSLNPTLVFFALNKNSYFVSILKNSGVFVVNVLSQSQHETSTLFAKPSKVDWKKVIYTNSKLYKLPIIKNITAYFECKVKDVYDGGDHLIFIGEVLEAENEQAGMPLIYFNQDYHSIGKKI
jgi:flavin reductase (DIM6/NTAB) family NADH-FMN oxidoreductase RutF